MNDTIPYISQKAVARVKEPLNPPACCRYCKGPVKLVNNRAVYGREFGRWPYVYLCEDANCGAYVGVHPKTDIPLGTLADRELRKLRVMAKNHFKDLLAIKDWNRGRGYKWLAENMQIPARECHFGWFDKEQCRTAAALLSAEVAEDDDTWPLEFDESTSLRLQDTF